MGYTKAPWTFKGRALYQLQLVKVEEARKYVPPELKLVECNGYTLGGFYLARYDDSPVGAFEELVALSGLVWDAPTSCAWAARVYVNNKDARDHGLQHVGLPSRLASFVELPHHDSISPSKQIMSCCNDHPAGAAAARRGSSRNGSSSHAHGASSSQSDKPNSAPVTASAGPSWWRQAKQPLRSGSSSSAASVAIVSKDGGSGASSAPFHSRQLRVMNMDKGRGRGLQVPVATFVLPDALAPNKSAGPRVRLSLPSYSGGTFEKPHLLKYACDLHTNIRFLPPVLVSVTDSTSSDSNVFREQQRQLGGGGGGELMSSVLGGRPLITMAFDDMLMVVQEPVQLLLKQDKQPSARGVASLSLPRGAWQKP